VKITVERCDKIVVAVSQIFDRVKSVALWSANIRKLAKDHKDYGSAAKKIYKKYVLKMEDTSPLQTFYYFIHKNEIKKNTIMFYLLQNLITKS